MAIGDITASRREVQTVRPRFSNRFATLTQGLGKIGQAVGQVQAADAAFVESARLKSQRAHDARLNSDFIRFKGQYNRDYVEAKRNYDPSGAGFEEFALEDFNSRVEEFSATIPEELRADYDQKIEVFRQTILADAFSHELISGDSTYKTDLGELAASAMDEITNGIATVEDWEEAFAEQLENSPLPLAETEALKESVEAQLMRAEFIYEVEQEALSTDLAVGTTGQEADGTNVVAANLPAGAPALLNGVASVESAGKYNVMYGGDTFSDYSDHPREKHLITSGPNKGKYSTAAGRYQFLASTWDEAATALGLTDFSPESQDRAAWWLAQRDYKKFTKRDLQTDLVSGDPQIIEQIRQTFAGSGLRTTWEGLQKMTPEEFLDAVSKDSGTPSALMFSPRYDSISYSDKRAIIEDANDAAQKIRAEEQQREVERVNGVVSTLLDRIVGGEAGYSDIISTLENEPSITQEQQQGIVEQYEISNKQEVEAGRFIARVNSGAEAFSPQSSTDRDQFSAFFRETGGPARVAAGDLEYFTTTLLPAIKGTGFITKDISEAYSTTLNSSSPEVKMATLAALAELRENHPRAFTNAFGKDVDSQALFYDKMNGVITREEMLERLAVVKDPGLSQVMESEVKAIRKDRADSFSANSITEAMGYELVTASDMLQAGVLEAEARDLFEFEYPKYRNYDDTMSAVVNRMSRLYGVSTVGGQDRFMKYPPEKIYEPYLGAHQYIDRQLSQSILEAKDTDTIYRSAAYGQGELTSHYLIPNDMTERDISAGKVPAMQVMSMDENGLLAPQLNSRGKIMMFRPEITDQMKNARADQIVLSTQARNLQEEVAEIDRTIASLRIKGRPISAGLREKRQELLDDMYKMNRDAEEIEEKAQREQDEQLLGDPDPSLWTRIFGAD